MIAPTAVLVLSLLSASSDYLRSRALPTGATFDPRAHCLWWPNAEKIRYSMQQDGNPETPGTSELDAIDKSFATWEAVLDRCSDLRFEKGPLIASRLIGYVEGAGTNTNSVIFRTKACTDIVGRSDACWTQGTCQNTYDCWEYTRGTIALTTTTFDRSGVVYDSDIELNSAAFGFTTADPPSPKCAGAPPYPAGCIGTDVQNTMTHEIGHLLGLDHITAKFCRTPGVSVANCAPDQVIESTMNNSAGAGETYKREVDPGSQEFICTTYPKGQVSRDCVTDAVDSVKRALDGGTLGSYECCSLGAPNSGCQSSDGLWVLGAGLAAAQTLLRRRRARGGYRG